MPAKGHKVEALKPENSSEKLTFRQKAITQLEMVVEEKILFDELKWIEDKEQTVKPPLDSSLMSESPKRRIWRKTTENIFVPVGLLATVACLTLGLVNLKRGDSTRQQFYMRGRVLFQGLTLLAMTAGFSLTSSSRSKVEDGESSE